MRRQTKTGAPLEMISQNSHVLSVYGKCNERVIRWLLVAVAVDLLFLPLEDCKCVTKQESEVIWMFIDDANVPGTCTHILNVTTKALAIAGYKILEAAGNTFFIRHIEADVGESDFEIKVKETP